MNYNIRPAELADLPRILEIYAQARSFMQQTGNPNQWFDTHPAESVLRDDIPKRQLYICTDDSQILAVFAYIPGIDPTYLHIENGTWLNDEPYGTIHRIAVATQGAGIAAQCFDWALAQCPNLRIDTHRDNRPMQRALEKYGFQYCGIIYLANGHERLAFHKTSE